MEVDGRRLRKRKLQVGFWQGMAEELDEDGPLSFQPLQSPCEAAVIWLHGFGDMPEWWADVTTAERRKRPSWAWIFPRAKEMSQPCYDGQAVTAWASFVSSDIIQPGSVDYDSTAKGYASSVSIIHRIIRNVSKRHGLPAERIAVLGVSQGAACAGAAALTYPDRLGGIAMISGWLIKSARDTLAKSNNPNCGPSSRIFLGHGAADQEVSFQCAESAERELRASGVSVVRRSFPGLDHNSGSTASLPDAMEFLDSCLARDIDTRPSHAAAEPFRQDGSSCACGEQALSRAKEHVVTCNHDKVRNGG